MNNTIPEFGIKRNNEERRDGGCAVIFLRKSINRAIELGYDTISKIYKADY